MRSLRYLENVSTLALDTDKCVGCTMCTQVCPHAVWIMDDHKAHLRDRDGCMECGACVTNCPAGAITVTPGVGCASYIIQTWIKGKAAAACGPADCC